MLRLLVQEYYEVETNVPVGDAPREADLVLLRRTTTGPLPFRGLWRDLTTWNVLEFKGPTVSPRVRDLDLLVELGLGIDRRLNEERAKGKQPPLEPNGVSFWYLANRLGKRFVQAARERLETLEAHGSGVWRGRVLLRPVFLVSSVELPVEEDSLPLHVLGKEPPETELAVGRFVVEQEALWERYAEVLLTYHPATWREVFAMAKSTRREIDPDMIVELASIVNKEKLIAKGRLKALIEAFGYENVAKAFGVENFVRQFGAETVLKGMGIDPETLTAEQRRELERHSRKQS